VIKSGVKKLTTELLHIKRTTEYDKEYFNNNDNKITYLLLTNGIYLWAEDAKLRKATLIALKRVKLTCFRLCVCLINSASAIKWFILHERSAACDACCQRFWACPLRPHTHSTPTRPHPLCGRASEPLTWLYRAVI